MPQKRQIPRTDHGSLVPCWLLAKSPPGTPEPTDYWLSTLPDNTRCRRWSGWPSCAGLKHGGAPGTRRGGRAPEGGARARVAALQLAGVTSALAAQPHLVAVPAGDGRAESIDRRFTGCRRVAARLPQAGRTARPSADQPVTSAAGRERGRAAAARPTRPPLGRDHPRLRPGQDRRRPRLDAADPRRLPDPSHSDRGSGGDGGPAEDVIRFDTARSQLPRSAMAGLVSRRGSPRRCGPRWRCARSRRRGK